MRLHAGGISWSRVAAANDDPAVVAQQSDV